MLKLYDASNRESGKISKICRSVGAFGCTILCKFVQEKHIEVAFAMKLFYSSLWICVVVSLNYYWFDDRNGSLAYWMMRLMTVMHCLSIVATLWDLCCVNGLRCASHWRFVRVLLVVASEVLLGMNTNGNHTTPATDSRARGQNSPPYLSPVDSLSPAPASPPYGRISRLSPIRASPPRGNRHRSPLQLHKHRHNYFRVESDSE